MDKRNEITSTGSYSTSQNPSQNDNNRNHTTFRPPNSGGAPTVSGTPLVGGHPQLSRPLPPVAHNSHSVTQARGMGVSSLQQKFQIAPHQQLPHASAQPGPRHSTLPSGPPSASSLAHGAPEWGAASHAVRPLPANSTHNGQQIYARTTMPGHQVADGGSTSRPMMPTQAPAHQPRGQPSGAQSALPTSNLPQHPSQPTKPKVVLSQEAKAALAKAIWSAIRSPEGIIAPDLMQAALAAGLPKHAILNAARVAREREALKRKSMKQQSPPTTVATERSAPSVHRQRLSGTPGLQGVNPSGTVISHAPSNHASNASVPKPFRPPIPSQTMASQAGTTPPFQKPKVAPPSYQQIQASKVLQVKTEERVKWRRVHHGVFMVQKGRFLATPHSISGIVRSVSVKPVIPPTMRARKRPRPDVLAEAARLQKMLRSDKIATKLVEPEKYKRVKIEAKKFSKALDRVMRKTRQNAAEQLTKQHKELSKAITSHQQEFFKFHKQRRADAYKVARLIRDNLDKESKKKEKDVVAAERARLAALKANDMDAYSKLLEETKNDRLKFLMDKTEKHFSQISTSLLQSRDKGGTVSSNGGAASYYASAHLKTEEVRQPGILVGGDLKEYQMGGLQWLVSLYNNKLNGILADEMGLGKTIQAISLIAYLMEYKHNLGPYLVIVPLSTLSNWVNEFHKWCPSAHVICYKGTPGQRKELYKDQVRNGHFNVLLTTYEYIIKDKSNLRKTTWQYAIVDEGHRMKNAASKFAKTLASQYVTKYRLLLTGTPLMNDLGELWSLLNFLLPAIFNSVDTFDQWFNRPFAQFGNSNEDEANFLSNEERMFIIHRLHELLRPFMLRRVKSEVLDQLPEKVEKVLRCELSSWQKELYKQISKKAVVETNLAGTGFVQPQPASRGLNNIVMQLRKVCNHPYLFSPEGYQINQNIVRSSGKLELLDRMLPKLKAAGHRVLMFTQMTAVMTILEDYFAFRGYLSLRLDGSTPAEEREKRMYKFNAPDSPYFIFLLSTRAGGLGLNLTAANTVVIFDSDWNPMMDLQAQDRAHRIGQRSDVSVFRLITYSPVEEKILSRATEKLNMSELVVEAGQFDKRSVENDNSLERKKMMEVLLTDFNTTSGTKSEDRATSEFTGSDDVDEDNDDDDNGSEGSKEEDLNELLSNNENDYQLYDAIDKESRDDAALCGLFDSEDDVPDWIKYPSGRRDAAVEEFVDPGGAPRKRKEVQYDDGLTEKQFLRLMDKQYDAEASTQAKGAKHGPSSTPALPRGETATNGSDLSDWTFRKLISSTKAVVALKDPATKRRLCDVFMEKPSPEQYPDYYELIEKPIAINDILRKCRGQLYANLQEFQDDWKLMFANAKAFNGDGSWVVQDGIALSKELERVLKKNGLHEEQMKKQTPAKPAAPPKPAKAKLRIKLSLKTLKAKDPVALHSEEAPAPIEDTYDNPAPGRSRRKKRKLT